MTGKPALRSSLQPAVGRKVSPPAPTRASAPAPESKTAFRLYLLFVISWFLHLTARVPMLGALRLDLLLIVVLAVLARTGQPQEQLTSGERISKSILALVGYAVLSIPLIEWPGSVLGTGLPNFVKALVFFYFTISFATSLPKLRTLVTVFVACQCFRIFEPLYLHLTQGYWGSAATMSDYESLNRLAGAPYDIVNPNGLAFIVLLTLPLLHYTLSKGRAAAKLLYVLLLPPMIYALLLTGSRSGLVGLASIVLFIWLKSKKKIAFAVVIVAGIAIAMSFLEPAQRDRYLSIWDSNTKNGATAEGRISGIQNDFPVIMRRPVFGHGVGTSREANANFSGRDQPSHNLYTEVAEELGFIGLAIFLYFLFTVVSSISVISKEVLQRCGDDSFEGCMASALQVWLGMDLLFSFASYGLSSYEWYFAAGLTQVLARLVATRAKRDSSVPARTEGRSLKWRRPVTIPVS